MNENGNVHEIIEDTLTPKQEAFCRNYTQIRSLFGNATLSYAEAYGYDLDNAPKDDGIYRLIDGREFPEYLYVDLPTDEKSGAKLIQSCTHTKMESTCASAGSRLLRNVKIDERITKLLNEMMNDDVIDARLTEIALNGKDQDSINAIKEYNKLKQRIIDKKDITSNGQSIA